MANTNTYLASDKVKIFPCAYRGQNSSSQQLDPAARLNLEENFIKGHPAYTESDSYIISGDLTSSTRYIKFVLMGYNIEITFDSSISTSSLKFANIKLGTVNLADGYTTKVIKKYDDASTTWTPTALDDSNVFKGICFTNETADTNASASIQLIDNNALNASKMFPITHSKVASSSTDGAPITGNLISGTGANSVRQVGNGLTATNENQVVFGTYNATPDANEVFSVGTGTNSERFTALKVKKDGKIYGNLEGPASKLGTSTVGANNKFFYLNSGSPVASTATIGSSVKPVYLSSGAITASTDTVGASNKPIYLNSGTITASTSNIGSSNQLVYMSSGTITAGMSILSGTSAPTSDLGNNGDIYIKYVN